MSETTRVQRRRICTWVPLALSCIVAAVALYATTVGLATPLVVMSGSSMVPALHPGDVVVLTGAHISEVSEGQIIAYRSEARTLVVHRVVSTGSDSIGQPTLVTKGDSNPWNDKETVDEHNYVGRVAFVLQKAGGTLNTLQNPVMLALFGVVLAAYVMLRRLA